MTSATQLPNVSRETFSESVKPRTERIIQFGEGNFLRAFADWMIQELNEKTDIDAGIVVVQPIDKGMVDMINDQDGLYHLFLNGIKNGEAVSQHMLVDSIQRGINPYLDFASYKALAESPDIRYIISNTTEAGIRYEAEDLKEDSVQNTYPAKVTALLHHRFKTFNGDANKGLIIIPCELIDKNGDNLKEIILKYASDWKLGNDFIEWISTANSFCNTLVDRIVPGYPRNKIDEIRQQIGYNDQLVVEGEQFHLWVIQGPAIVQKELPFDKIGLNVVFTDDIAPFRTRKVRVLNGGHTCMVPVAYLYGIDAVRQSVEHEVVGAFLKQCIYEEICPTLDSPQDELKEFAGDVIDRFRNPYLEHRLMSISLNSISKFKTRVLPSLLGYQEAKSELPKHLVFSLASTILFYRGKRGDENIELNDDAAVLSFFKDAWSNCDESSASLASLSEKVLGADQFWGTDLDKIPGLTESVASNIENILKSGMVDALKALMAAS